MSTPVIIIPDLVGLTMSEVQPDGSERELTQQEIADQPARFGRIGSTGAALYSLSKGLTNDVLDALLGYGVREVRLAAVGRATLVLDVATALDYRRRTRVGCDLCITDVVAPDGWQPDTGWLPDGWRRIEGTEFDLCSDCADLDDGDALCLLHDEDDEDDED